MDVVKLQTTFVGITSRNLGNTERKKGSSNVPSSLIRIYYNYFIFIKIRPSSRNAMCRKT